MKRQKPWMVMVSEYTALAFVLPTSTFLGYVIGYLLDKAVVLARDRLIYWEKLDTYYV